MTRAPDAGRLEGLHAALLTPVDDRGRLDRAQLAALVDFVLARGVDGLCLGGATGEYPRFGLDQRRQLVEAVAAHLGGRAPFVTAIGAPSLADVVALGEHALAQGSRALLVPMPHFYRYAQDDLAAYVRAVACALEAPCYLYNLPAFTNALQPETALALLESEANVVGVKDSSGDRRALPLLRAARAATPATLLCGSDGMLLDALEAGWDGAISGIASVYPEGLVALYRHHRAGRAEEARACQQALDELVQLVGRLPFPWSLRVAAEVRGLPCGPFPYPAAPSRLAVVDELRTAYAAWFERRPTHPGDA